MGQISLQLDTVRSARSSSDLGLAQILWPTPMVPIPSTTIRLANANGTNSLTLYQYSQVSISDLVIYTPWAPLKHTPIQYSNRVDTPAEFVPHTLKNLCLSRRSALGLSWGSFCRQMATRSRSSCMPQTLRLSFGSSD